jgi:hypothetical protein
MLKNAVATIPFHIEMRRLYRGGDRVEHELSFGVVGVEKPASVIVASDNYADPVITERCGRGGLELSDRVVDTLAVKCFRLMSGLIIEHDGDSGWWTIADVSRWVRHGFSGADAEQILKELSRHVQPGMTVRSTCLVADDDAI